MELGSRLKQARLEAGLSQRQLCGDRLTRNMLSLIENGSAQPSMDTLLYLAATLNKPVSYFLDEESVSPNQSLLQAARSAYSAGNSAEALDLLAHYATPDPVFDAERYYLEALICLSLYSTRADPQLLTQAAAAGSRTPYYTPDTERRRLLLLAQACPEQIPAISRTLPDNSAELLLRGDAAMDANDPQTALQWYSLAEKVSPELAWPRLEICHRALEDYRLAYHYACLQRK